MSIRKTKDSKGESPLAEYQRIEVELRRMIDEGHWMKGAMLPGRRDLARQHSVSLVTLDRAIGPLLADGIESKLTYGTSTP
jgi:DNA-binding GntR family transcriptional regulator